MGVDDTSTADPVDESTTGMGTTGHTTFYVTFFLHYLEPGALALGSVKGFLSGSESLSLRKTGRNMNTREIKVLVNGKNICLITMEPVLPFGDGIVKYGFNFSIKVKQHLKNICLLYEQAC